LRTCFCPHRKGKTSEEDAGKGEKRRGAAAPDAFLTSPGRGTPKTFKRGVAPEKKKEKRGDVAGTPQFHSGGKGGGKLLEKENRERGEKD